VKLEQKEHWPSERSGQAIAANAAGDAVYLWGGLNFTEETVYNDAWKWSAGNVLVVYGCALFFVLLFFSFFSFV
jgi:hypothetical protein